MTHVRERIADASVSLPVFVSRGIHEDMEVTTSAPIIFLSSTLVKMIFLFYTLFAKAHNNEMRIHDTQTQHFQISYNIHYF